MKLEKKQCRDEKGSVLMICLKQFVFNYIPLNEKSLLKLLNNIK